MLKIGDTIQLKIGKIWPSIEEALRNRFGIGKHIIKNIERCLTSCTIKECPGYIQLKNFHRAECFGFSPADAGDSYNGDRDILAFEKINCKFEEHKERMLRGIV
jgi:hypothetical protein